MKAMRRTEIILETRETTVIRFRRSQPVFYCPSCQMPSAHLTLDEGVSILSCSESEILRLAETGQIHSRAAKDGFLLLCGSSLAVFSKINK